jgi:hypothetical protein
MNEGITIDWKIHDALMHVGIPRREPACQCGTEVEADALEDASRRVGTVAFGGDLLVEVVVMTGARLVWNLASKWVFARRLVEVSVDTEILACRCHALLKPSGNDHFIGTRPQSGRQPCASALTHHDLPGLAGTALPLPSIAQAPMPIAGDARLSVVEIVHSLYQRV